jgi:hypothetical protein
MSGHQRALPSATAPSDTALVKCASHRAREKMLALVGREDAQALYSLHRETGKGGYRDGPDLHPCWPSPPTRELLSAS